MTPEQFTTVIVALTALVGALAAAYVQIRSKLDGVHQLVNSQLEKVMNRLDMAIAERDAARETVEENKKG